MSTAIVRDVERHPIELVPTDERMFYCRVGTVYSATEDGTSDPIAEVYLVHDRRGGYEVLPCANLDEDSPIQGLCARRLNRGTLELNVGLVNGKISWQHD